MPGKCGADSTGRRNTTTSSKKSCANHAKERGSIYIPGITTIPAQRFYGAYGNITIQKHAIHKLADGRRMLIIHGHELDTVVQNVKWLAFAGDVGYQFLLSLNPVINFVRRRFGLGYWSLSAYAKKRVKDAVSFIGKFEAAIVRYAEKYSVDAVLCGHIHSAIHQFGESPITIAAIGSSPVRHLWSARTARSSC